MLSPALRAPVMYSFALATDSLTLYPSAILHAIADDSVQPVPCVLGLSTGLSVIRAFGREKKEEERFDKANKELTKTMLFTNRVMTFMMPVMMLIMNCLSVGIVWVGAHRIDSGVMQVGSMTAFITYAMQIVM